MSEFSYEKSEKSVGQAVYDIMNKPQQETKVSEILEEYADDYVAQLEKCVQDNLKNFESPFYVLVLHKKEAWATNVVRNWFIARQTAPTGAKMWHDYPNFMHTLYKVDSKQERVDLVRTLPSWFEAKTVVKNGHLYDEKLVKWCREAFGNTVIT